MSLDKYDTIFLTLGSERRCSHNLTPALESGVLVASVTSIEDDGSTDDLTINNEQVSSSAYTEDKTGDQVAVGKAVQWSISTSSSEAKVYLLKITYVTDSDPADTVVDYVYVSFSKG